MKDLSTSAQDLENRPGLCRWFVAMEARPAVQRGIVATIALAQSQVA